MTELQQQILAELALHDQMPLSPAWIADSVLRGGNEAWPFQVRSVQGCLLRMEGKGWVKRDWPAFARRSRGWKISESGRAVLREAGLAARPSV